MIGDPHGFVQVGDPNPIPDTPDHASDCPAQSPEQTGPDGIVTKGLLCTREDGHPGQHIAEGVSTVVAVWQ